jgi:RNA polymerase sigma-70 factor (ECF subfamily)
MISVQEAHRAGAAAWSGIELSVEDFAQHVEARLSHADASEVLAQHGADLYLACACARGNAQALELFSTRHLGAVPAMVAHIVPASRIDELVQSLRESMLVGHGEQPPNIATYRGTGPLGGWVRVSATRAAIRLKKRDARVNAMPELAPGAATVGPETLYLRRLYGPVFEAAMAEALSELPAESRELLRRYHVEGMTIDDLAKREGIHRATAARRIHAAERLVLAGVRQRAADRLGLADEEIDTVMRVVASQLEISLRQL